MLFPFQLLLPVWIWNKLVNLANSQSKIHFESHLKLVGNDFQLFDPAVILQ